MASWSSPSTVILSISDADALSLLYKKFSFFGQERGFGIGIADGSGAFGGAGPTLG